MHNALEIPDLLRLIDERSTAFRAAIAAAPTLDVQVPTCPEWSLRDLARHLGEGRFAWAATVTAGPDATAKSGPEGAAPVPQEREALLAWLAASTRALVEALQAAGPDRGCWTWWGDSQSPRTCRAVARHQLQEIAVHTYDAQLTVDGPQQLLPEEVALDGVEDFLFTICATTSAWPHDPAVVDYRTTEGRAWRVRLSADGARVTRLPEPATLPDSTGADPDAVEFSTRSPASELVLAFYGRLPLESLEIEGDRLVWDQLVAWDPGA